MSKVLVIEARYYSEINDLILEGVNKVAKAEGCEIDVLTVPGALEIPAALNTVLNGFEKYDGYVVSGCIIRGETSHYDIVCNESARGIYNLVQEHNLALGNVILTVENKDQAVARADCKQKDKGGDAIRAVLAMIDIKSRYG